MADKTFTEKQREIVARKMGYEGPMDMFDKYLKSTPADAQRYGLITEKFMAKGGMVKKMFTGGMVQEAVSKWEPGNGPPPGMTWSETRGEWMPSESVEGQMPSPNVTFPNKQIHLLELLQLTLQQVCLSNLKLHK
jgi:hypothetical protein